MSNRAVAFLKAYETAIAVSDLSTVAACYADVFMFGGPKVAQPIKKADFLKIVPKREECFASIGLVESELTLVEDTSLDSKYSIVKTRWKMTFEKTGALKRNVDTSATFILQWVGETGNIVFQIDHQDLAATVNELRLA